jgi:hypothetical protein
VITAEQLDAISRESITGFYALADLCAATGHAFPLVVPAPNTAARDALPDPFLVN